mmetsp:Transcript_22477/g.46718  ORF Transcript_22477/g.46718 Transcript_22477/m.46718 type:complete len:710 (+) Transcript_22477:226-2355(+)
MSAWSSFDDINGNKDGQPANKKQRREAVYSSSGFSDSWGAYEGKFDGWKVGGGSGGGGDSCDSRVRNFPSSSSSSGSGMYSSAYNSTYAPPPSTAPSSGSTKQKSSSGWINKHNSGSQKHAGDISKFDEVMFERKMKSKEVRVSKTQANSIGLDPTTIYSLDEGLKSLNTQQRSIVHSVIFGGLNVFFTGPAGTGKSKVLNSIIRMNKMTKKPKNIVVSATTGIAACAVGGVTVHSFAGVGVGSGHVSKLEKKVMSNEYAKARWKKCEVLIIDEISMMEGAFLNKLDVIAKHVRGNTKAFGGIQLVMCGDFFQLPPVKALTFAFEAPCWCDIVDKSILLTKVYRQNSDPTLVKILNEARVGDLSDESFQILAEHMRNSQTQKAQMLQNSPRLSASSSSSTLPPPTSTSTSPPVCFTKLECRNVDVDTANEVQLRKLDGEFYSFSADDYLKVEFMANLLKHCPAPQELTLKEGAQVMLLKNIDSERELVNGSRGTVTRFVHWTEGRNEDPDFTLPRGWKKSTKLPVVQFTSLTSGQSGESIVITPKKWENMEGEVLNSSRVQLPLRLAWSLSVHKSQGMTIPRLEVSLKGVFEFGQAYVALSRATCMKGLVINNIDRNGFRAHPTVKKFYEVLEKVERGKGAGKENGKGRENATSYSKSAAPKAQVPPKPQAPLPKSSTSQGLTEEQKRKIEENRAKAQLLRMRKKLHKN